MENADDDYTVDDDEDYSLDDISEDITAATDLINDRLQRIEQNTAATAKWIKTLTLVLLVLIVLNFIAVLLAG
jgi:hypothetical protein